MGWALDPNDISQSIIVNIFFDTAPASARMAPALSVSAGVLRNDLGAHGFSAVAPTSLKDGQAHLVYVYALDLSDTSGSSDILLTDSPMSVVLTAPPATASSDTTVPVISAISSSNISQTGATVTWTTNEASDIQVEYGTTTSYGTVTTLNSSSITAHSVTLANLSPNTLYNFRVKSRDTAGNLAVSANGTFTTLAVPTTPDTATPPAGGGGGSSGGGGGGASFGGGSSSGSSGGGSGVISSPLSNQSSGQLTVPSSLTIKLVNDNGTYYLVQSGQRRGITNPGMLSSYGFSFNQAKMPSAEDKSLPQGTLLTPCDGSLVKSVKDRTVYLISNQQRYAFISATVFLGLGFKFSSVLVVTDPELQILPKAGELSDKNAAHLPGLDINRNGTIYWIGGDLKLYPYPSVAVYNSWHLQNNFTRVVPANSADMQREIGAMVTERVIQ